MMDNRVCLPIGTVVELDNGEIFEISGGPIGYGGGSILYPANRQNVHAQTDAIQYVLKECYPASGCCLVRKSDGAIAPKDENSSDLLYLHRAQLMQLQECAVSQKVYRTASRMLPIRSTSQNVILTMPSCNSYAVPNTVTIMDSLSEKGQSLSAWIKEKRRFTPAETFRIIQQLLFSLREVHQAGHLHLDIQDGNVFLRGSLEGKNELVTLIDFGCAREMTGGRTAPIRDKVIFTTQGFTAPEILLHNDGNLQLGPEADIFSVGCLILYLLTGLRANVRELIENRTGIYLRSNQLRRIKCPKHLVDSLQHVLAMSLDREPENRYHSVDAMLEDVTALAEALQPYRTDLSSVKYDAFVCYKHGSVDSVASLTLQRALENYRAPKGISDKKKPFGRIFVDEGELSSCGDFGQQIREALKNSGWLIVICSPETPLSPWVRQEIDIFLEYHDRSRILAVLIGGTPETAFPLQLKGDASGDGEVFAAHAFSNTPEEAKKLLKGDALLKIAAPMLGTTYDTLKQRHRIYRLQRIAAVSAGLLMATAGFAAYAMNRAAVIARQAEQIEAEYSRALINESLFLAEQAQKQLDSNDPLGAMELALQALPSEIQKRPVLTEAEYVLGKALGIYTTPGSNQNTVTVVGKIETDKDQFLLDETGNYLFAWGSRSGGIQVWETGSMTLVQQLYADAEYGIQILGSSDSRLLLSGNRRIACADYITGKEIWSAETPGFIGAQLSDDGRIWVLCSNTHAVFDGDHLKLTILSTVNGSLLRQFSLPLATDQGVVQSFCISETGDRIAFVTCDANDRYRIFAANLQEGTYRELFAENTPVSTLRFAGNDLVLIRDNGFSGMTNDGKTVTSVDQKHKVFFECYDTDTGTVLFRHIFQAFAKEEGISDILPVPGDSGTLEAGRILFVWCDRCVLLEQTGKVALEYTMPASVVNIRLLDGEIQTVNADGSVSTANFSAADGMESVYTRKLWSDAVSGIVCQDDLFYVCHNPIGTGSDYTIRKYQQNKYDDAYQSLWQSGESGWRVFGCYRQKDVTYTVLIRSNQICTVDSTGIAEYYQIPETCGFTIHSDMSLSDSSLNWFASGAYYKIDLTTGNITGSEKNLPAQPIWDGTAASEGWRASFDGGRILIQDSSGTEVCTVSSESQLVAMAFTPDETGLLAYGQGNVLTRYDVRTGEVLAVIDLKEHNSFSLMSATPDGVSLEFPDAQTLLAVTKQEGFLLDLFGGDLKLRATVDHCIGYTPETDAFLVADMETLPCELGCIPRYSLDELICKGNHVLGR